MLAAGAVAAFFVVLAFWVLLQSFDMGWTVCPGFACPKNSCFCADCDLGRIIYIRWTDGHWQWQNFYCEIIGLSLNRCFFSSLGNLLWLVMASRLVLSTLRDCRQDPAHVFFIVTPCMLGSTSAIPVWNLFLSRWLFVFTVFVIYDSINIFLLASSMSIMFRLASLQEPKDCGLSHFDMLSREFPHSFLPIAAIGVLCVSCWVNSTADFDAKFFERENKFYSLCLILDLLSSAVAYSLAGGISTKYTCALRSKMQRVAWQLLGANLFWFVFRWGNWLYMCHYYSDTRTKEDFLMTQVERLTLWLILWLIKVFTMHYVQLNELPSRLGIRDLDA